MLKNFTHDYKEIFTKRGGDYHKAMLSCPLARNKEFEQIVKIAEISDGMKVIDCPSGGGYLRNYIEHDIDLVPVEFTNAFNDRAEKGEILLSPDGKIPLDDNIGDRVISLAGLHHKDNLQLFLHEIYRCLKPEGLFAVSDVLLGSDVDRFLNIFVHENSTMGHEGKFLIPDVFCEELSKVGFKVKSIDRVNYNWQFYSIAQMVEFCKLLFGIDKASDSQVEGGIREYLGVNEENGTYNMPWELLFVSALK